MNTGVKSCTRPLLGVIAVLAIVFAGPPGDLLAQTKSGSPAPRITLFRILPTTVEGEQWHEFHWNVVDADRVRLFHGRREMHGRIQLADGSFGWPLSMSGGLKRKLASGRTFVLSAETRDGQSVRRNFTVKLAGDAPPQPRPAPKISSFRVAPASVEKNGWIKFFWDVQNAKRVRLFDDVGEIEGRGWDLRENGTFSTTIRKTTEFRLLAEGEAGKTASKAFTVRVVEEARPRGNCAVWGRLNGKWRQRVKEHPNSPASIWRVQVFVFAPGSNRPSARASVSNSGIYRFEGLNARDSYVVRPGWASSPRQGRVSCSPGKTHKGPAFQITGGPLID